MNISISERLELHSISGGSGIIRHKNSYYVIGDDAPHLYVLNQGFSITQKIKLLPSTLPPKIELLNRKKPTWKLLK